MPTETPNAPAPGELDVNTLPKSTSPISATLMANALKAAGLDPDAQPAPAKPATPEPAPATPPAKPAATPEPKPAPKAATPPAPEPKPAAPASPKDKPQPAEPKEAPAKLREAYERAQARAEELNNSLTATTREKAEAMTKLAEYETKLAKYEERIAKELEPQVKRLSEVEKQLQEREQILRIKDYTATPEFHDKYVKPLAQTHAEIQELMAEVVVNDNGEQRPATMDDFNAVLAQPNLTIAAQVARQKFGDDIFQSVMSFRQRVKSLTNQQREASNRAALEAEEWHKNQNATILQRQQALREHLLNETKRFISEDPDMKPESMDEEAKASVAQGEQLLGVLLDGAPNLTQEQLVGKAAQARARILKSYRLEPEVKRLKSEIEALNAELAAFRRSEPGVETRSTPGNTIAKTPHERLMAAAYEHIKK